MRVLPTRIPDVLLVEPDIHQDERGFFMEAWNPSAFAAHGIHATFVQDNLSYSKRGVLRGLHLQQGCPQAKLLRVLSGEIYDVVVDLRPGSAFFGQWSGIFMDASRRQSLWIPEGFAHGYYVTSADAEVLYKVTAPWYPPGERVLRWDDPSLNIRWPLLNGEKPLLSPRDAAGLLLSELD
jgi:dTDP-4-dehydrorhamnose 3,5-epimerase